MYTNKYIKIINKIYLKYKRERGFLFCNYLCLFLMLLMKSPVSDIPFFCSTLSETAFIVFRQGISGESKFPQTLAKIIFPLTLKENFHYN